MCNKSNARLCGGCLSSRYCSTECQRNDRPTHKHLCKKYRAHTETVRPGPSYRRAVLFEPDRNAPEFVWIECKPGFESKLIIGPDHAQVEKHMGPGQPRIQILHVGWNPFRPREMQQPIEVAFRESHDRDGSGVNQAIVNVTRGQAPYDWKGPVLAMKRSKVGLELGPYEDIGMPEFVDLIEYFLDFRPEDLAEVNKKVKVDEGPGIPESEKVKGVKINCQGDIERSGALPFMIAEVPKNHPIFTESAEVSGISKLVGYPVRAWKYPADPSWKLNRAAYANEAVKWLYQCADPENQQEWGRTPSQWKDEVGSVLVVRDDGKDISPERVHALCQFSEFKAQPIFNATRRFGHRRISRQDALSRINPEYFEVDWRDCP